MPRQHYCRNRRRKCEFPGPGLPCTYCLSRRIQCTGSSRINRVLPRQHSASSEKNGKPTLASDVVPSTLLSVDVSPAQLNKTPSLPPQALCVELVNLYFDFIHDQFHSLFHRKTFEEDLRRGKVPPVVLYAMMALSARFSTNPAFATVDPRDRTSGYMKESERLLNIREVSLTTIQACILLGALCITEGDGYGECVYYSTACRIAMLIDLPNRPASNGIEREVNLRGTSHATRIF